MCEESYRINSKESDLVIKNQTQRKNKIKMKGEKIETILHQIYLYLYVSFLRGCTEGKIPAISAHAASTVR